MFRYRTESLGSGETIQPGLRPPQIGALHAIAAHWSLHRNPATVVMPTGTGKTETMLCALACLVEGTLLVIVPSDPLRSQTAAKFDALGLLRKLKVLPDSVPNPIVGTVTRRPQETSELDIFRRCNVVISTMSALGAGTAVPLAPDIAALVDTLFVDEAHHVAAASWSEFRAAFADKRILQFTATPFRRDGKLVDGQVIFNYPLRLAQQDGYFRKIAFEPVHEIDPVASDMAIAEAALARLRADRESGLNHLLMARCVSIPRATEVHSIYAKLAPDLNPQLVHSESDDVAEPVRKLRSGECAIVVCVNMLGEGFDLPELKIAAIHDVHKSLAVLLQFVGRFTRSAVAHIGDATVVANIADPDVIVALERLYSEDADWNLLLSELSSAAAREHAELIDFLQSAQQLDAGEESEGARSISHHLLRPILSTLLYRADDFRPKRFHIGLPKHLEVHRVWLHTSSNTLFFVTKVEAAVKWSRTRELRDRQWSLFVLHFDAAQKLLFLSSSDRTSQFQELAEAVGGKTIVHGDVIFRALGHINRLIFQNVGVRKHGRRNLSYALYTGADVAEALTIAERAGSVKSNLSATGWENGRPVAVGCSYKGRVWSREAGAIPAFVKWSEGVGQKILDDTIDTRQIIANVLIPEVIDRLPDEQILGIDWPVELIKQSEEKVTLTQGASSWPLSLTDIRIVASDAVDSRVTFELLTNEGAVGSFDLRVGGVKGFMVTQVSGDPLSITVGSLNVTIEAYFSDYPPLVRFVDLSELDGNLIIKPQDPTLLSIPAERFESWDWATVDITKESTWKDGTERTDAIQPRAARQFVDDGYEIVYDDDAPGEAADLVCLKEEHDHISLVLVHCKFSGSTEVGERVKDVVEVSSQAIRSAKWTWKFRELCRHLTNRERQLLSTGRSTRYIQGNPADLNRILRASRFKEVRSRIVIVQPGLSRSKITSSQSTVLAAALAYLKQTVNVDLDVICAT